MEKRRDCRMSKKVPIRFTYNGSSFQSITGDISRRGVFIQTAHAFPSRNGINIEIQCKNNHVHMAGFIVWSKKTAPSASELVKGGMGIQLLDYQKQEYQELLSQPR
ncbi:MAG: PilZ domain-containing protein [Candidatus Aminicenantes bacterium]|nr:PilZ domain-containing protein [Candidatus Aminicenantes bacterium]